GDVLEPKRLELRPQLVVLDPPLTEVHPPQKGHVALHAGTLTRALGAPADRLAPKGWTVGFYGGAEIRTRIRGRGAKASTGIAGAFFSSPGVRASGHYGRHSPLKFPWGDGAIYPGEPAF